VKTALQLPVLYVTHALDEIVRRADLLVLIGAGHVVGYGSVSDVSSRADLPQARVALPRYILLDMTMPRLQEFCPDECSI
jgi:ABC-type molybdate transport system ATPase subunit